MKKILAINGSYRDDGITDQVVDLLVQSLVSAGAQVEVVLLRDYPINFCLNCRECTQTEGVAPGTCVQRDGMDELITRIEAADAYILASPTNFGSVTALFKRFMERLVVYAYWPWEMNGPTYRKANEPRKKAVLLSSCAAPGFLGRLFFNTQSQLKTTAKTIGADSAGSLVVGLIGKNSEPRLPDRVKKKIPKLASKLI